MARKDKPVKLREVTDDVVKPAPVIRLGVGETREEVPVRVVREVDPGRRLELPDRREGELRTHQPDIDVLIEPDIPVAESPEEAWGESTVRKYPVPWGWFALIGSVVVVAVLWSLAQLREAEPQVDLARSEAVVALEEEELAMREAGELVEHIEETLKKYFAVDSIAGRLEMVRHPGRVQGMMEAYYAETPLVAARVERTRMLRPLTYDGPGNFWSVTAEMEGGDVEELIVEVMESGQAKIDWETHVVFQPMPWDEFVAQRPTGQSLEFRVRIEPDEFHSHEFADPEEWACFRLTAPGGEEALFGYARRGGVEAEQLAEMTRRNGGRPVAAILQLSVPEGLQSRRGVVIEKIANFHWIYLSDPGTGS